MKASAPGRICLLGEHCDWHGVGACLVSPLPLRVEVEVEPAGDGITVTSDQGHSRWSIDGLCDADDPNRYIAAVIRQWALSGIVLPAARVRVHSNLPAGRGFSSSAAVCVASARALAGFAGASPTDDEVADIAYRAERVDLGVACGRMDPLACAREQVLAIDWSTGQVRAVDAPPMHLLAAAFAEPTSASTLLAALQNGRDRPDVRNALKIWGEAAVDAVAALEGDLLPTLGVAMNRAQTAYDRIELPACRAPGLRSARDVLQTLAWGSKFSGAGGDRSLVALFPDRDRLEMGRGRLEELGLLVVDASIG